MLHAIAIARASVLGGRSSRTFQSEGRWDALLAPVQKGDFVVIQFGHNAPCPINDNFRDCGSIKGVAVRSSCENYDG